MNRKGRILPLKYSSKKIEETHAHARLFSKTLKGKGELILLEGSLGSGKTEWVRGLVYSLLGKKNASLVSSPSYSLVNIYSSKKTKIYHVDLFRIKNVDDLESLG